jgi:hypothetical protein
MLQTQAQPQYHPGFNDENMASVMQSPNSKKRKRPSTGDASAENQNNTNPEQDISTTAAAALTAHLSGPDTQNLPFANTSSSSNDRQLDDSFNLGDSTQPQTQNSPYGLSQYDSNSLTQNRPDSSNGPKPAPGSDEWHKVRRDNHKEGTLPPNLLESRAAIALRSCRAFWTLTMLTCPQLRGDAAKRSTRE